MSMTQCAARACAAEIPFATPTRKPVSISPLKVSAPLGGAMAFLGMAGSLPLFHGAQGCTAFALVSLVRHFREAIPLQTTAMNEITTILGGMDNVEEALLTLVRRAKPAVIGILSTALTETRGEDLEADLKVILARQPELAEVAVIPVHTPDTQGSLETGWSRAVEAIIGHLVPAQPLPAGEVKTASQVTVLPGAHLTPGDVEHLRDIIEDFGLEALILPDLSGSLDGHVPDRWTPTTLGGTRREQIRRIGRSRLTLAVGEHMRAPAELLRQRTGVPTLVFDRLSSLESVDRLMVALASASRRPVPVRYRRQRSQLVDAMLDGQFAFAGRKVAIAGETGMVATLGGLAADMGAQIAAAVSATPAASGSRWPFAAGVAVGDLDDLETRVLAAGGADLLIAGSHARDVAERQGLPLFRAGFPIHDRPGVAQRTGIGYRGTRDLIVALASALLDGADRDHHAEPGVLFS